MSLEDFRLLDNIPFDNSINKRDFLKIYLQQGAQLNDPNHKIDFIFGEIINYHQIGKGFLEFEKTVRNPAGNFIDASCIGLINNAFAYCFK